MSEGLADYSQRLVSLDTTPGLRVGDRVSVRLDFGLPAIPSGEPPYQATAINVDKVGSTGCVDRSKSACAGCPISPKFCKARIK